MEGFVRSINDGTSIHMQTLTRNVGGIVARQKDKAGCTLDRLARSSDLSTRRHINPKTKHSA